MAAEAKKRTFSQFCVLLQSKHSFERESSLNQITLHISSSEKNIEEVSRLWNFVSKSLLRILDDPSEKCRTKALDTLNTFITTLPNEDKYITYLLPILSKRLGSSKLIETCENIRLTCVQLLKVIIAKYGDSLASFVDDLNCILTRTMMDTYSMVRQASLHCVSEFAKNLPKHFYSVSQSFVKPILGNLTHKHCTVRMAAILAIGDCIRYGNSRSLEEVANPLAQRLSDEHAYVREAVTRVAGDWMLQLPDRYSWWHKILPLLLTGLHDLFESVRLNAVNWWDKVGKVYLKENKEDEKLKSKMDFLSELRHHYPANVARPNLGCRVIAQQTFGKLINGICLELGDWQAEVRVRAAQLLCVFLLNVEEEATQHIAKILPAMYRACKKKEDSRVVENVERAAEYIGYFVPPETYCWLIIATFEEDLSDGHLAVFSAVLKGSERCTLSPMLPTIAQFLQKPNVCQNNADAYQEQMLGCCNSLILVCNEDCKNISGELFSIIFTVLAMAQNKSIVLKAQELLHILTDINSLANVEEFYDAHVEQLFPLFDNYKSWSSDTAEAVIFSACLVHVEGILARHADFLLPIFKETTNANADSRLRLKHFTLLSRYFDEGLSKESMESRHVNRFLVDCIIPNLIWSAGKTAEAIRVAAVSCFQYFLLKCEKTDDESVTSCVVSLNDQTIPLLLSLADDNSTTGRLCSVNALRYLLRAVKRGESQLEEWTHKTCPVLLRRLDDGNYEVRKASLAALREAWKAIPKEYDLTFNGGHVDTLYTALLIYLDDLEVEFQVLVLDCLKELAVVHPELLYRKLEKCRSNFKNQTSIDTLMEYCRYILRNE